MKGSFMKAFVNQSDCILCGMCGGICPEIFMIDSIGKSKALDIELTGELLDMAKHAESICPVRAITIR
jgi:ferredoxin